MVVYPNPFINFDWFVRDIYNEKVESENRKNDTNTPTLSNPTIVERTAAPILENVKDTSRNIAVIALVIGGIYLYSQVKK